MFNDKISFSEDLRINDLRVTDGDMFAPIGHVRIIDKRNGEIVVDDYNKAMLSASEYMALHLFQTEGDSFITPTYNSQLELDNTQSNSDNDMGLNYITCLFCMGTSGCNRGSRIKNEVSNKLWIAPDDMVPFRYQPIGDDLDDSLRSIYNGRKTMDDRGFIAYYFKKFDSDPIVSKLYDDGTPWTSSVYDDQTPLGARVKVGLTATVDEEDGRDWFDNTTGINDGVFNTISLLLAWPSEIDGYTYYQDVRPLTRLNFPDRSLSEIGASWSIKYDLYF
jgi:hypothetical protein